MSRPDIKAVQMDYQTYLRRHTAMTAAIIMAIDAIAIVAVLLLVR